MKRYITIDGGTTNTRIYLVKNKSVIDSRKLSIGAKADTMLLKTELKSAIKDIIKENGISEKDIVRILASGMITSEFGLCNLEHINTPAGLTELHDSMHEISIPEISDIPFVFIRGVKSTAEGFENTDIMRGEETELMGIINTQYKNCIYVLPGSHSKIITTDDSGKICDFSTMLTGEMIASLAQNTILKDAVDLSLTETDAEYLLKGFDYSMKEGINKTLFKTRILKNIFKCSNIQIYSFFLGAVLCGEIECILKQEEKTVVIGGKAQIKNAMAEILKTRTDKTITALDEMTVDTSTAIGAVRIYENKE